MIPSLLDVGRFLRAVHGGVITWTAVFFGAIWVATNFYQFYPFVQYFLVEKPLDGSLDVYTRHEDSASLDEWPTFDVLLPAYEEGSVIHQSIASIREADYPQERIEVNVLVEPDDEDTRSALDNLRSRYEFREITIPSEYEEIVVPEQYPGVPNKPRALNYGFDVTDATLVGVVDAEDAVDPQTFRSAANALVAEDADYAQGILDMVNCADGWKNTLFRAEYAFWYRLLVPSFFHVGYPVPLGGTTNFFHRDVLESVSEIRHERYGHPWDEAQRAWLADRGLTGVTPWDPKNVTEDFELGLLLWQEGYDLALLDVVTREESPLTLNGWIRQRTRWQKGKVYTFLQYLRTPPSGPRAKLHSYFQSSLPHLAPVNIAGIVMLAMIANLLGEALPLVVAFVLGLGLTFIGVLMAAHGVGYWLIAPGGRWSRVGRTLVSALTLPFYWVLHWGAELRALRQVYRDQLHWEKTEHHGRNGPAADGGHAELDNRRPTQPKPSTDGPPGGRESALSAAASEKAAQESPTAPSPGGYSIREVITGLLVLCIGLLLTVGLPLLVG